jgi:hypothetical protein
MDMNHIQQLNFLYQIKKIKLWKNQKPETKQEYEIKQFPKMYHPTDDLIKIPIYSNGDKIVITIEKVDPYTVENTEDKIYTNSDANASRNWIYDNSLSYGKQ